MRTDYDGFRVDPLTPRIGAEVVGVHMGEVDAGLAGEIHQAWMDWKVLFFRDQDISAAEHIAFGRRFGELEIHPFLPNDGNPEIVVLDSRGSGPYKANYWHTDVTFRRCPPMGSILRGRIIPSVGGDTCWIDMERVYEDLDDDTKELLEGRTATHSVRKSYAKRMSPEELEREVEKFPDQHHPVVRTHPVTGRRCLFVNRSFVMSIDGLEPDESDALLARLVDRGMYGQLEHQVRFRWREGSFAMWDNRSTQHYAVHDYAERRRVERVTLVGDLPV